MLTIDSITVAYGPNPVVQKLSLSLAEGEIGCLLGASGCGKTTVLRAIAGFEPVRAGAIRLHDDIVAAPHRSLPPEARRIGVVFQDYALFPHLTVADNVGFGLHRVTPSQRRSRVADMLELVGLAHVEQRYPHELSGGQQQRVALARALAPQPRLMLMDEPFSNLDVTLRERLAEEVRAILKRAGATAILVTHDQREAFAVADRVGVMTGGNLRQWDTPYALYHQPADRYVAGFIGEGVLLPARLLQDCCVVSELGKLTLADRSLSRDLGTGHGLEILIRPDAISLEANAPVSARVVARAFRGAEFLYTLELPSGGKLLALAPSRLPHEIGSTIGVRLLTDQAVAFRSAA